jgi:hypothetical protein
MMMNPMMMNMMNQSKFTFASNIDTIVSKVTLASVDKMAGGAGSPGMANPMMAGMMRE